MTFWSWSRTAATNASADSTINWAEGQAPSSINDSARAVMAAAAKFRDDISGAIVTAGTSTAYTVASYQVFDTLAHLNGQLVGFSPHTTNADTVTLNVDGLGAKPLRSAPGVEVVAGTLVQGTPYVAVYNSVDGAFYLRGYFSNPYIIPFLGGLDYWDTITPNSSFIFPAGQAISRSVYSRAFARWGTTYGAGDGSTTFNVPNKAGRVSAMKEASASLLTSSYFGGNSTTMGATGGSESHTLTVAELATHFHTAGISDPGHAHAVTGGVNAGTGSTGTASGGNFTGPNSATAITISSNTTGVRVTSVNNGLDTTNNTGSGNAHAIVQPTIVCNYIIRII